MTVGDLLIALALLSLLSLALCQACRDWEYPYTLHKAHKEPMKQDDPYQNAKDAQATLLAQTIAVSILAALAIALLAALVSLCGF